MLGLKTEDFFEYEEFREDLGDEINGYKNLEESYTDFSDDINDYIDWKVIESKINFANTDNLDSIEKSNLADLKSNRYMFDIDTGECIIDFDDEKIWMDFTSESQTPTGSNYVTYSVAFDFGGVVKSIEKAEYYQQYNSLKFEER